MRTWHLVLVALLSTSACTVKVDLAREGFPCDPDGSCSEGLACVDSICVLALADGGGEDGGTTDGGDDGGTSDGGGGDGGTDGGCPLCGVPTGPIVLQASPPVLPADGTSISQISSDPIIDLNGTAVPDGTLIDLTVDLGGLSSRGSAPAPSLQLETAAGQIALDYEAHDELGTATISATSVEGDATGSLPISLIQVGQDDPAGVILLTPTPALLPADGTSTASVVSDTLRLLDGNPVPDGTRYTLEADLGTIQEADVAPGVPGLQVSASGAQIAFTYQADLAAGPATITAASVMGSAWGETTVTLEVMPATSVFSASPENLPADDQAYSVLNLEIRDGAGALIDLPDALLSTDLGTATAQPSPGPGLHQWHWSSPRPGLGTATVTTVDGRPWGLSVQVDFENSPPQVLAVDVAGRIPWDAVPLQATATDPNPGDLLTLQWTVTSGPDLQILQDPSVGGPGLTTASLGTGPGGPLPLAFPPSPGTYLIEVRASDGDLMATDTLQLEVRDFVDHTQGTGMTNVRWEAVAVDPASGDVCVSSRDDLIAMHREATGNWTLLNVSPFIPAGLTMPAVAWSVDPGNGTSSCLIGNSATSLLAPSLLRVSHDPPGGLDAWTLEALNETREINGLAAGPGGVVWIAFQDLLGVLQPGANVVSSTHDFNARTDIFHAIGVTPSGTVFATDRQGGHYLTGMPFDPLAGRELLTNSGAPMRLSQPALVTLPSGRIGAWVSQRSGNMFLIDDVDSLAPTITEYPSALQGQSLRQSELVQRTSPDGDVWQGINNEGVARYLPRWDEWVLIEYNSLPGDWTRCDNINSIAVDSVEPAARGRRLFVACETGALLELVGDP